MFKNHSFLVKPVKDEPMTDEVYENHRQVEFDRTHLACKLIKTAGETFVVATAAYFAGDTIRQIAIHTAKTTIK